MVHKLFIDSRAAKEGTPSDFVWAPDRRVSVGRCRAFLDAVHIYNQYLYIAEELPSLTVLATATKVYLKETISGTTLWRILTIPPAVYDGPGLAQALATALGAGYTTAFVAGGALGTVTITTANTYTILSRA